jgi:hypothetical protein
MRYDKFDFKDTFYRATGRGQDKLVLDKLGKLISRQREVVVRAIQNAGIKIPHNAKSKLIIKTISDNIDRKRLQGNLGLVMLVDTEIETGGKYEPQSTLFGSKEGGTKVGNFFRGSGNSGNPTQQKTNFFNNLFTSNPDKVKTPFAETGVGKFFGGGKKFSETSFGGIFQGKVDDKGNKISGSSPFSQWAGENSQGIMDFGTSLISAFSNKNSEQEVQQSVQNNPPASKGGDGGNPPAQDQQQGMPMGTMIIGGVLVVGIIVVIIMANKK